MNAQRRSGVTRAGIDGLVGVVALLSVAAALVSQYRLGMEPCPWCILQRMLFIVLGLAGLLGWLARPRAVAALATGLGVLAALGGIAAGLWQYFVAARSASCNLTLADKIIGFTHLDTLLPAVFEVRASCADAEVKLLGVPFELLSVAGYAVLGAALLWAWRRGRN